MMVALIFRLPPSTVTFRDHGRQRVANLRGSKRLIFRSFLRRADLVALINEWLRGCHAAHGYALPVATCAEPAFVPPPAEDEYRIRTDYDSISIREDLHFGCPAVASDAMGRPQRTVLFVSRNLASLAAATRRVFFAGCAAR